MEQVPTINYNRLDIVSNGRYIWHKHFIEVKITAKYILENRHIKTYHGVSTIINLLEVYQRLQELNLINYKN